MAATCLAKSFAGVSGTVCCALEDFWISAEIKHGAIHCLSLGEKLSNVARLQADGLFAPAVRPQMYKRKSHSPDTVGKLGSRHAPLKLQIIRKSSVEFKSVGFIRHRPLELVGKQGESLTVKNASCQRTLFFVCASFVHQGHRGHLFGAPLHMGRAGGERTCALGESAAEAWGDNEAAN